MGARAHRGRLPLAGRDPDALLRPLVEQADHVVAGHGGPIDGVRALAILNEDVAYLEGLPDATLPIARRSAEQKRIHGENLERL